MIQEENHKNIMGNFTLIELLERFVLYRSRRNFKSSDRIRDYLISLGLQMQISSNFIIIDSASVFPSAKGDRYYTPVHLKLILSNGEIAEIIKFRGNDLLFHWTINEFIAWAIGLTDSQRDRMPSLLYKCFGKLDECIDSVLILIREINSKEDSETKKLNLSNPNIKESYKQGIRDGIWNQFQVNYNLDLQKVGI